MTGENNTFRTFRVGPWSVINALQFRKMFTCWRNKNKISRGLEPRPSHRRVSRPDSDCGRIRRNKIHLSLINIQYLEQAHLDIHTAKQLRLVICCVTDNKCLGFVDLFDFDPLNKRAGVGILIYEPESRRRGFAREALNLLIPYCFDHLGLHQLFANVGAQNQASIQLFEALGFIKSGVKRDWHWSHAGYIDELIYQKINE